MSDDALQQNQNGLPSHFQVQTSISGEDHHDDSPLFPPLKEKPLIENAEVVLISTDEEILLPKNDEILLAPLVNKDMLQSAAVTSPLIDDNTQPEIEPVEVAPLIENEVKTEIDIPMAETQVESSVDQDVAVSVEDNIVLDENTNSVLPKVDDAVVGETNNPSFSVQSDSPIIEEAQNPLPVNEVEIASDSMVFDTIKDEIETPKVILNNNFIKNSNVIKVDKVIPIPHVKIQGTIDSEHPLTLPPRVIPFSTPAPSAHAKIAAVYTQPDARASIWLPWMRTSMWSRKMVKRATKHPEVNIDHENLPVVISNGKPNVVYSPVYISPDIAPVIVKEIKTENVFEKAAQVSRVNFEITKEPVAKVESSSPVIASVSIGEAVKKDFTTPKIDDSFDAAIFGIKNQPAAFEVAKVEVSKGNDLFDAALLDDLNHNNTDIKNDVSSKIIEKPKVTDSWDAAMFT